MEILTGVERRRRWSSEEKLQILREASAPGSSVGAVARRHDICRSQIYRVAPGFSVRKDFAPKSLAVVDFLPVEVCDDEDGARNQRPTSRPSPASSGVLISIDLRHDRTLRLPSDAALSMRSGASLSPPWSRHDWPWHWRSGLCCKWRHGYEERNQGPCCGGRTGASDRIRVYVSGWNMWRRVFAGCRFAGITGFAAT